MIEHQNEEYKKMKDISFKMSVEYFKTLSSGTVSLSSINTEGLFDQIAQHLLEWVQAN